MREEKINNKKIKYVKKSNLMREEKRLIKYVKESNLTREDRSKRFFSV